jgi:hypothetical protein
MKCYQVLDIPNFEIISNKFFDFLVSETDFINRVITKEFPVLWEFFDKEIIFKFIPELSEVFKSRNNTIEWISAIGMKKYAVARTHVDTLDAKISKRILWPVKNCDKTFINFYDVDRQFYIPKEGDGWNSHEIDYFFIQGQGHRIIDKFILEKPTVFDTSIPHGLVNNTRELYICFTIQTKEIILEF